MLPCLRDAIKCLESGHTSSVVSSMLLDFQEKTKKEQAGFGLKELSTVQCQSALSLNSIPIYLWCVNNPISAV